MSSSRERKVSSDSLRGKRVGIIGAGTSGIAAGILAKRLGASVLVSDSGKIQGKLPAGIEREEGGHGPRLLKMDLLIRSPGVPGHLPVLERAAAKRIPIWSEMELGYRFARFRDLVAITGTNGKTTTTTLVGELFRLAGRKTFVGGNIGTPLSALAPRTTPASCVVVETSSYQLEDIERFRPTISAILNITPDHLEHHGTMTAYADAKARIFENQTAKDVCVLNADDRWCRRLARRCRARVFWFSRRKALPKGIWFKNGTVHLRWQDLKASWPLETRLPGPHNVENILAAVAMAAAGGISIAGIRKVLKMFRGVEHRLEEVRELKGVRYVNDSKGTNVDSTRVALESFTRPLLVIMGGRGKGSPYAPLKPLIRRHVKRLLLIGEDAPRIRRELSGLVPMVDCGEMARAVQRGRRLAVPGDIVLLSPACASFDQYQNYEERGRHFKSLVRALR